MFSLNQRLIRKINKHTKNVIHINITVGVLNNKRLSTRKKRVPNKKTSKTNLLKAILKLDKDHIYVIFISFKEYLSDET